MNGFSAHASGVPQVLPNQVYTPIVFSSVDYDEGSTYDAATGFWTPNPADALGPIIVDYKASVYLNGVTPQPGGVFSVKVVKVGGSGAGAPIYGVPDGNGNCSMLIAGDILAQPGDQFEVQIYGSSTTPMTINSGAHHTWFAGHVASV
jgi:hypothetical protein